ncbi:MAG: AI-2E family transporter [Acidimicrobiia bacterium]
MTSDDDQRVRVPRALEVAAAWSWRLILVGVALWGLAMLVSSLWVVFLPVAVALLLATALTPVRRVMTDRGVPLPLAMLGVVVVFFGVLALAGFLVVPPLVDEFRDIGATLESAADEVQEWLVDGPLGLDREMVDDARRSIERSVEDARVSDGALMDGATLAGTFLAGLLLSLVVAFFVIKDGPQIQRAVLSWFDERQQTRLRAAGNAAWSALGGYVVGSASLGAFEAVVIGATMLIVGAGLALPVAVLTFFAAFFPFVGAVTAGIVAVSVTLVTSGAAAAGIVALVAVAVQQLDNDLLAPVIFGKALELHPLIVILAITTGGALAGLAGAFVAVPLVAVLLRATTAVRAVDHAEAEGDAAAVEEAVTDPPSSGLTR